MPELSYVGNKKGLLEYIGREMCEDCYGEGIKHFYRRTSDGLLEPDIESCHCEYRQII